LINGMVRIHRPHRLDAAVARVTEEHREASHTRSDQWSGSAWLWLRWLLYRKVWAEPQHQRLHSSGEHLWSCSHPYTDARNHSQCLSAWIMVQDADRQKAKACGAHCFEVDG
jgi:hypothetical protein